MSSNDWVVKGDGSRVHRETREVQLPPERAPVQGYSRGIPWSMHLDAYDAYCKKYSDQIALIDWHGRSCRGGFGTEELDMFIPGWREKVSEFEQLKQRVAAFEGREKTQAGSGDFAFGSTVWPGVSKLIEEAGEVIQVLGKLMQRGGRTDHWSGDLSKMLVEEIGDLLAAVHVFIELNPDIDAPAIGDRMLVKLETFRGWHRDNLGNPTA